MIQFIADIDHYMVVLEKVKESKSLLWIGTAEMEQFDSVWRGEHCKKCGRRDFCGDPIIK